MSRATRQETFIRSLTEGLCLSLEQHYRDQPRQKPKLQALQAVKGRLEEFWQAYPIQLERNEGRRVIAAVNWFDALQNEDPDLTRPQVLIALVLALAERLKDVTQGGKREMAVQIAGELQNLYDWFDPGGRRHEWLLYGARVADLIVLREI